MAIFETTSALILAGAFMMPATSSQTKNWLRKEKVVAKDLEPSGSIDKTYTSSPTQADTRTKNVTSTGIHSSLALVQTLGTLETYGAIKDGWDGEGSSAPSKQSLLLAKKLLDLMPGGISVPFPMIAKEGTVGFYWSTDSAFADIEIDGDNSFSLYLKKRTAPETERFEDGVPINEATTHFLSEKLALLGSI